MWDNFCALMDESGWDPRNVHWRRFVESYCVEPTLVKALVAVSIKRKLVSTGSKFCIGDRILLAIRSLRNESARSLSKEFGGTRPTVQKAINLGLDILDSFDYVLTNNFPTKEEELEITERLEQADLAEPGAVLVADCIDLPIWSSNDEFYCHKKRTPGKSAIRVRFRRSVLKFTKLESEPVKTLDLQSVVFVRRDNLTPVWTKTGVAPSSSAGPDSVLILGSKIHQLATQQGETVFL